MNSLRFSIREIAHGAEAPLTVAEIHGLLTRRVTRSDVSVTVCHMCDDRQLKKKRAPAAKRGKGVQYVYATGPELVVDQREGHENHKRGKGFMELAREREAKARVRKAA